jgi:hypothetical protein
MQRQESNRTVLHPQILVKETLSGRPLSLSRMPSKGPDTLPQGLLLTAPGKLSMLRPQSFTGCAVALYASLGTSANSHFAYSTSTVISPIPGINNSDFLQSGFRRALQESQRTLQLDQSR